MARLILIDGPDNAGKTSLINRILMSTSAAKLLDFPKRTASGRFTIESRNEVAIFETMLKHLGNTTYILDRGYISNIVYGELRAMSRKEKNALSTYREDLLRLLNEHEVYTVGLTRSHIECDFTDDLISLSDGGFNKVVDLFEEEYNRFGIKSVKILKHTSLNEVVGTTSEYQELLDGILHFIKIGKY